VSTRSTERIVEHYRIERALALRLLEAPREQRYHMYGDVYDDLFQRVGDHPQLEIDSGRRAREAADKFRFVNRFVGSESRLMELGAGDCAFSRLASSKVRRVVALDVSELITSAASGVSNLEVVLSDGINVPVPPASIDVAFSDQLMEHMHPDDVSVQLENIATALAPGGVYVCVTPNRLTGPHDVSRGFTERATGLHLREYSNREMRMLLLHAGFHDVQFFAGGHGHYVRVPRGLIFGLERGFEGLPQWLRRWAADRLLVQALFGVTAVATR
jgi:SAM-dependent methyltransferase